MNLRILAVFIIILGIVILAIGGTRFAMNQSEKFDSSKSKGFILGGRDDVGNWLGVQDRNDVREMKRGSAMKLMIAGALVTFVGLALSVGGRVLQVPSTKAKDQSYERHGSKCLKCGSYMQGEGRFCDQCGEEIRKPASDKFFCPACGAKLAGDSKFCESCGEKLPF